MAVAVAVVGLVASAAVKAGAARTGMVRRRGADAGVAVPTAVLATTATSYVAPGDRPFIGQLIGDGQVTVTGALPPVGTAVKVKEENGPPSFGGDAVRLAVLGEVGLAEAITGALQGMWQERSETKCIGKARSVESSVPRSLQRQALTWGPGGRRETASSPRQ